MKYTLEESLQELSARCRRLCRKRKKKALSILSAASLLLFAGLVSTVKTMARQLGTGDEISVFGAFVLPDTAGGYILAGVIAFSLGATVTLVCLRYRKRTEGIMKEEEKQAIEEEKDEKEK